MKTRIVSALVFASLLISATLSAQTVDWNTYHGGTGSDPGTSVVVDSSGNIYLGGYSDTSWGTPINAHAGGNDMCVVKLDSSGVYQWHTYIGGAGSDGFLNMAIDGSANLYLAGYCDATWGTPLNAYAGGTSDMLIVKLNTNGIYQWHTFHGGAGLDNARGIWVDGSSVYVCGASGATWGTPVSAFTGTSAEAVLLKLNTSGVLQWNTFCGGTSSEYFNGVSADSSGNIVACGTSSGTWGTPVNAHSGSYDILTASFGSDGSLSWHTFQGSAEMDEGQEIRTDSSGNIITVGYADASFGTPLNVFAGSREIVILKLNSSGALQWHTFYGAASNDVGYAVCIDGNDEIYVSGEVYGTFGSPFRSSGGGTDAFLVKLDPDGSYRWHGFLGGNSYERSFGLALAAENEVLVCAAAGGTWGTPISPYTPSGYDFSVTRVSEGVPALELSGKGQLISDGDSTPDTADDTDYGTLLPGMYLTHTFTIENTGTDVLSIGDLQLTGTDSSFFTVETSPASTVDPGLTTSFDVKYTASALGLKSADVELSVSCGGGLGSFSFTVQGEGLADFDVSGSSTVIADGDSTPDTGDDTDFGPVISGVGEPHIFTIENNESVDLTLEGVAFTGTDAADFNDTSSPSTISASSTGEVEVRFTPSSSGVKSAEVNFTVSAGGTARVYTFSLSGEGIPDFEVSGLGLPIADGDVSPDVLDDTDFGTVKKGKTASHVFTIANTGAEQISIDSVTPAGTDAGEFTVTVSPASTVDAGLTSDVEITFSPSGKGLKTADCEITVSAGGSSRTYTFAIQGTCKKVSESGGCAVGSRTDTDGLPFLLLTVFGFLMIGKMIRD